MNRLMLVLLPATLALTAIHWPAHSAAQPANQFPLGAYFASGEAWTIELNVESDGSATYEIVSWEAGGISRTRNSEFVKGFWKLEADLLTVSFSTVDAGKAVVYKATTCLANDWPCSIDPVSNSMQAVFSRPLAKMVRAKGTGNLRQTP